jgi:hypothetical protein
VRFLPSDGLETDYHLTMLECQDVGVQLHDFVNLALLLCSAVCPC